MKTEKNIWEKVIEAYNHLEFREVIRLCNEIKLHSDSMDNNLIHRATIKEALTYWMLGKLEMAQSSLKNIEEIELEAELEIQKLIVEFCISLHYGKLESANDQINLAHEKALKHLNNDSILLAKCKIILGNVSFYTTAGHQTGVDYIKDGLEILQTSTELGKEEEIVRAYYCLMKGMSGLNERELSLEYYNKSLEACKNLVNPNYWLGQIYLFRLVDETQKVSSTKTLKLLAKSEKAFIIALKEDWEGHWTQIRIYTTRGAIEMQKGDYYEAIFYFDKVWSLAKKSNDYFGQVACESLSKAYTEMGDEEKALKYIEQALKLKQQNMKDTMGESRALVIYGDHLQARNFELAKQNYLESLRIIRLCNVEDETSDFYLETWEGLAAVSQGAEANYYIQKILDHCNSIPNRFRSLAKRYKNIGNIYLKNQNDKAEKYYLLSLKYLLSGKEFQLASNINWETELIDYTSAIWATKGLAQFYFNKFIKSINSTSPDKELLKLTLQYFNFSIQILDYAQNGYKAENSKFINNEQFLEAFKMAIKAEIILDKPDKNDQIFYFIEKSKSRVLQSNLIEGKAKKVLKGIPYYQKERDLKGELLAMDSQINQLKEEDSELQIKFFEKRIEYQNLTKEIEEQCPEYKHLKYQSAVVDLDGIQTKLKENQKILNYFLFKQTLFAFVIDDIESIVVEINLPKNFEEVVNEYINGINTINEQSTNSLGFELYQYLIQPIWDALADIFGADEPVDLIIIPHSYIAKIPFGSLIRNEVKNSEQPDYLINYFDISYHYSASLLYLQKEQKTEKTFKYDFVGFAPGYLDQGERAPQNDAGIVKINEDQVRNSNQNFAFQALPFSQDEVNEISSLFQSKKKASTVFLESQASKTSFGEYASQAKVLHLAAHFHQDDNPKLSGLVFNNNEFLYIREAFNLDLQADLVVLSACESAIGKLYKSEGMIAINRGLLYSGVQKIISTLFKVNDEISYLLMFQFYQNHLSGMKFKKALNEAKRQILKEKKSIPVKYWASFVLIGD